MLDHLSVKTLLTSVIALMAAIAVLLLGMSAWDSARRLAATSRMEEVADASVAVFTAMHNLRTDRATTTRDLDNEAGPYDAQQQQALKEKRDAEMPALRAAAERLAGIDVAGRDQLLADLKHQIGSVTALQERTWDALGKPRDARPPGLGKAYFDEVTALLQTLDRLSERLSASIKGNDAVIDQMMEMKQLGWMVRNAGGDASLKISTAVPAGHLAPEEAVKYQAFVAASESLWSAFKDAGYGTDLPAKLRRAIDDADHNYFGGDYLAQREAMVRSLVASARAPKSTREWATYTVSHLGYVLNAAVAAIDAAKDRASELHGAARLDLILQLAFLAGALGLAAASMVTVGSRVTTPLQAIRHAMLKVAAGDVSAQVSLSGRRDEIGALWGALAAFKQNAVEKARIEDEQHSRRAQAETRQRTVDAAIAAFESQVRQALEALSEASGEMRATSERLSRTAEQSTRQVNAVTGASEEASNNVQTVAAASEELSLSIAEISRAVGRAASIAGRAVEETRQTDSTVQGLAETAARIGAVVKLISEIASQTNLLALNATIEAARAGEAGKGFAVVASEVKSLANQTAKATEDIAAQIVAVQSVSKDAVEAINRIGGTIGEVNTVATSIATAVEQQGAATQEITRNTQQAARRTKDVSENIGGVAAGTDETGKAAQGVKSAADALTLQADRLRAQVKDFLDKIRAA
jgi:methyl-accepting chemotaxis protein